MELLLDERSASDIVEEALAEKRRLPGFGHKVYRESDPRTQKLFELASGDSGANTFIVRAQNIEEELFQKKGRKLPVNIDGAAAALLLGMGIPPSAGNTMFLLGRMPGFIAHALNAQGEKTYRR